MAWHGVAGTATGYVCEQIPDLPSVFLILGRPFRDNVPKDKEQGYLHACKTSNRDAMPRPRRVASKANEKES